MSGAVVLFSGGQDSTTCLAWACDEFGTGNVYPISFTYGQRHAVELAQALKIIEIFQTNKMKALSVEGLSQLGSAALTNKDIDVEAQASEDSGNAWAYEHGLPSTFIPGRNLLFLTFAAAYGATLGIRNLVTGICEADASGYPDCRNEFRYAAQVAISKALDDEITVYAPLIQRTKAQTFMFAKELGVLDIVVEHSHTCYHGNREIKHEWGYGCGECPACVERAKGWKEYQEFKGALSTS